MINGTFISSHSSLTPQPPPLKYKTFAKKSFLFETAGQF